MSDMYAVLCQHPLPNNRRSFEQTRGARLTAAFKMAESAKAHLKHLAPARANGAAGVANAHRPQPRQTSRLTP